MDAVAAALGDAAATHNYDRLGDLLWIPVSKSPVRDRSVAQWLRQQMQHVSPGAALPAVASRVAAAMGDVLAAHLHVVARTASGAAYGEALAEAYQHEASALQALLKALGGESRAETAVLKRLCTNLYYLAVHVDTARLEDAARLLSRAFTTAITDRSPLAVSKKWAAIPIANVLFRCYFRLGTVRLCTNIVRAIDTTAQAEFPALPLLPKSEAIAFRYFCARLAINQSDFKRAEDDLLAAVAACPDRFPGHKRQLMIYLVLVRMIHGVLPAPHLLARHNLTPQYAPLAQALRSGDLRLFDQVLLENQTFYMQREIFLVIQLQLRNLILRSFFKKVYLIGVALGVHQENRLSLRLLDAALTAISVPHSGLDEVECLVANLIFHNFIKGYISHEKGLVVLSKKNAFPAPNTFL